MAVLLVVWLIGCSSSDDADPPLSMYTAPGAAFSVHQMVATRVQACWFGGGDTAIKDHVYDITADSAAELARITVYKGTLQEKIDGDADVVFVAQFQKRDDLTEIDFPTQPKDQTFAARLKTDVIRWANGSETC